MASDIRIIQTGRGLAGSRVALIFAPPDAAPSELSALTDYLNQQEGIKAVAGYHGPNQNHVLRVSGIPDDAQFRQLLKASPVQVEEGIAFDRLDEAAHFPHQTAFRRAIKENANTLTGISYMAGSMALLLAAWRKPRYLPSKPPHDWYRSYTAMAYFAAAAILVALSRKHDNPRDVYTIMESLYPALEAGSDAEKAQQREQAGQIEQFIRNHPWELSMLLNASGAGAHAISAYKRGWKTELAAALATLSACVVSAVVPEKGGRSLIPVTDWLEDSQGRSPLERLEAFAQSHPAHRGWIQKAAAATDWLQENPLKVSSYVSGAANVGYAISGIKQPNYPLTAMSAAFAAGNYTQSQATKGRGDGFDSVVSAAAELLKADKALAAMPPEERQKRIEKLVDKLIEQREIVHPKARLLKGIKARLGGRFLPSEERLIKANPFTPLHSWRENVKEQVPDAAAGAAAMM